MSETQPHPITAITAIASSILVYTAIIPPRTDSPSSITASYGRSSDRCRSRSSDSNSHSPCLLPVRTCRDRPVAYEKTPQDPVPRRRNRAVSGEWWLRTQQKASRKAANHGDFILLFVSVVRPLQIAAGLCVMVSCNDGR